VRCAREGLVHPAIELALNGRRQRIDMQALTGKTVTIYGQTEVTKDLIAARLEAGAGLVFGAKNVTPNDFDGTSPRLTWEKDGETHELACDVIAGCDGYHGVCRASLPAGAIRTLERTYPFAWLGILADVAPAAEDLIYARSERGFALFSMRSKTVSRNYIQCDPEEDLADWPDERVWEELALRLGPDTALQTGPVRDKSVTPMRSFVAEPLRHGRLFLAGDAGHIVPPTGAKGLNLAASDIHYLFEGLLDFFRNRSESGLAAYSGRALSRIWKAQRFSWWMTSLLHNFPDAQAFDRRVQDAEIDYVLSSEAAQTALAENYVGLPF
jgi:p-hydroxybenzoate 3-monooxygenase